MERVARADKWTTKILARHPDLNVHVVKYHTKNWFDDDKYVDKASWKQLEMDLPPAVRNKAWDVILVDAPLGHRGMDRTPQRGALRNQIQKTALLV